MPVLFHGRSPLLVFFSVVSFLLLIVILFALCNNLFNSRRRQRRAAVGMRPHVQSNRPPETVSYRLPSAAHAESHEPAHPPGLDPPPPLPPRPAPSMHQYHLPGRVRQPPPSYTPGARWSGTGSGINKEGVPVEAKGMVVV
ncbi:hypothetical protein MKEN_00171300 [Mycena kentingensis (nom. inval.)]|nr:hypothetical protein MKEN_00171300 [Mycena kentingensis (nom. inval.)]